MGININNPSANNVTLWVNLYADYSPLPYLGNVPLNTSSIDPFIYVPKPPNTGKTANLALILGLTGGGLALILIVVAIYCYFKKCRNSQQESDALETVY